MIRYGILGFGLHAVRRLMPGFGIARNSRGPRRPDAAPAAEDSRTQLDPAANARASGQSES